MVIVTVHHSTSAVSQSKGAGRVTSTLVGHVHRGSAPTSEEERRLLVEPGGHEAPCRRLRVLMRTRASAGHVADASRLSQPRAAGPRHEFQSHAVPQSWELSTH